jgi:DNA-binding protein HU-beta
MTKAELIDTLSTHNDIGSKTKADRILTFLKETIIAELSAGNQVVLGQDFGTFKPVTRAARTGVNPTTKAAIQIPASKTIKFSISAPLKRELNN